jgi:mono/diheme cytochrome c family protein
MLKQRSLMIGFVLICLLALGVFVVRRSSRSAPVSLERADATNAGAVAHGRQIYATRCASCHGSDLKGEPGWPQRRPNGAMPATPLDQRGPAGQRDDQWLFTTIKQGGQAGAAAGGTSSMPAFGSGLTDADIWAVISYIKSTWTDPPQQDQPPTR